MLQAKSVIDKAVEKVMSRTVTTHIVSSSPLILQQRSDLLTNYVLIEQCLPVKHAFMSLF